LQQWLQLTPHWPDSPQRASPIGLARAYAVHMSIRRPTLSCLAFPLLLALALGGCASRSTSRATVAPSPAASATGFAGYWRPAGKVSRELDWENYGPSRLGTKPASVVAYKRAMGSTVALAAEVHGRSAHLKIQEQVASLAAAIDRSLGKHGRYPARDTLLPGGSTDCGRPPSATWAG
jgi:hypothetical protein